MKKLLTILVLIMLIISFFQITSMYALYKEKLQGEYNTLLGAWEIKVNTKDITTSGQVEKFTIADNQLGYVASEYIQAGKIAPNGQAYFDIVIDPANTDVSIVYQIDIDKTATSKSTDPNTELTDAIELISVENYFGQEDANGQITNQTTNTDLYQNENTYTGIIPISKITQGYKNYLRLYFRWNNVTEIVVEGETQTVVEKNNEEDTAVGSVLDSAISIPLQINLKQYTGEVLGNES